MILRIIHKRERAEDANDKYFIVQMFSNGNKSECGYIEKEFDEDVFKSKIPYLDNINIFKVIEFKNKLQYLQYKEKYKNEVNF